MTFDFEDVKVIIFVSPGEVKIFVLHSFQTGLHRVKLYCIPGKITITQLDKCSLYFSAWLRPVKG